MNSSANTPGSSPATAADGAVSMAISDENTRFVSPSAAANCDSLGSQLTMNAHKFLKRSQNLARESLRKARQSI